MARRRTSKQRALGGKPKVPEAAALRYQQALLALFERAHQMILKELGIRKDAPGPHWDVVYERVFTKDNLDKAVDGASEDTRQHVQKETKAVIGLPVASPKTSLRIESFRKMNVDKIKSLVQKDKDRIRDLLDQSTRGAMRPEDLADLLQEQFDVTESKAQLLARDQTLKLNGQLVGAAQQDAGIETYQWSTSGDERVRPGHAELDGNYYRWDDPPVTDEDGNRNHPGEDYQCRCVAIPVLPELEED